MNKVQNFLHTILFSYYEYVCQEYVYLNIFMCIYIFKYKTFIYKH